MHVKDNIRKYEKILGQTNCRLIAVSKTKPVELIQEAYEAGQLDFGENKVQELREKPSKLPLDIRWHMIGHLQTNKVKYIAPFIYLIHAVDSLKLLKEINKQALKNNRTINCLLQVHIASEENKFGFDQLGLAEMLSSDEIEKLQNIKVTGLMGMATNTDNKDQIRQEFKFLNEIYTDIKLRYNSLNIEMTELSIGMSNDFQLALEEGSTMIRIGSNIFGARNYIK